MNIEWTEVDRAAHWYDLVRTSLAAYEARYGRTTWIMFKQNMNTWTLVDGHGVLAGSAPASLGLQGAFERILQAIE